MTSPFFIVGTQRSGTTLLSKMIGNHSDVLMEDRATSFRLVGGFDNMYDLLPHNLKLDKKVFLSWILENDTNERIKEIIDPSLLGDEVNVRALIVDSIMQKLNQSGKAVWGDKAPNLQHFMRDLLLYIPDAKFIHIVRDGRATVASMKKRSYRHIKLASDLWLKGNSAGLVNQLILGSEQYLFVKYEDLLLNPEQELKNICNFLNIDFQNATLDLSEEETKTGKNYVKSFLDTSKMDSWKEELKAKEIAIIERIQRDLLMEFGYSVEEGPVKALSFRNKAWLLFTDNWKMLFRRRKVGMQDWQLVEYNDSFRSRFGKFAIAMTQLFLSDQIFRSFFSRLYFKSRKKSE